MTPEPANRPPVLSSELVGIARALSESDLSKVHPADAHALLEDLHAAIDSLKQVTAQLSWGHTLAVRGRRQAIGDSAVATVEDAAAQLLAAARFLSAARDAIAAADETNSEIRWKRRTPPGDTGREA